MVEPRPPSLSEAAPRVRQKAGPFPRRRSQLRFPSTGQLSSPQDRKQVRSDPKTQTPSFEPLALAAADGPMLLSPAGGCPEPAPRRTCEEATGAGSPLSVRMALKFLDGPYRRLRPLRAAGEAALGGSASRGWRRMKGS